MRRLRSHRALQRCIEANPVQDFTFFIKKVQYQCPRALAILVSANVEKIVLADSTCFEFHLNINDEFEYFQLVMDLCEGQEVTVNLEQSLFIMVVAEMLQSRELAEAVSDLQLPPSEITSSNAIYRIVQKEIYGIDPTDEVNFIATHFSELAPESLMTIPLETLEMILSHADITIPNEKFRFKFISELVKREGDAFSCLFEFVDFSKLPRSETRTFVAGLAPENVSGGIILALVKAGLWMHPDDDVFGDDDDVFRPPDARWKTPIDLTVPGPNPKKESKRTQKSRKPLISEDVREVGLCSYGEGARTIPLNLDLPESSSSFEYDYPERKNKDTVKPEVVVEEEIPETSSSSSSSSWSAGFKTESFSEANENEKPESEAEITGSPSVESFGEESEGSDSLADW